MNMTVGKWKRNDRIVQSLNTDSRQENKGILKLSDNKRSLQQFTDVEDQPEKREMGKKPRGLKW